GWRRWPARGARWDRWAWSSSFREDGVGRPRPPRRRSLVRRTVIAALGVLALVAAACSNSSKPTRPVAKPGQIVTVLSNADGGVRDPVGRRRHAYYDLLAVAPAGDVYVGDGTNNRVLKAPRGGKVTTVLDCDSVF